MFKNGRLIVKITPYKNYKSDTPLEAYFGTYSYMPANHAVRVINQLMIECNSKAAKVLKCNTENILYIDKVESFGYESDHKKKVIIKGDKKLINVFKSILLKNSELAEYYSIEV